MRKVVSEEVKSEAAVVDTVIIPEGGLIYTEDAPSLINTENEPAVSAVSARAASIGAGVVKATRLNVRKSASMEAEVVEVLEKGSEVQISFKSSKGDWYRVRTAGGSRGYCLKEFIEV